MERQEWRKELERCTTRYGSGERQNRRRSGSRNRICRVRMGYMEGSGLRPALSSVFFHICPLSVHLETQRIMLGILKGHCKLGSTLPSTVSRFLESLMEAPGVLSCGSQLQWALEKAELLYESLLSKAPGPDKARRRLPVTLFPGLLGTHT